MNKKVLLITLIITISISIIFFWGIYSSEGSNIKELTIDPNQRELTRDILQAFDFKFEEVKHDGRIEYSFDKNQSGVSLHLHESLSFPKGDQTNETRTVWFQFVTNKKITGYEKLREMDEINIENLPQDKVYSEILCSMLEEKYANCDLHLVANSNLKRADKNELEASTRELLSEYIDAKLNINIQTHSPDEYVEIVTE